MTSGSPSQTARIVAAYRLGFDRPVTAHGDPDADDALTRDLADKLAPPSSDVVARYLRGRTVFFDRVVTAAMQRHVSQVVSIGSGYDGRAFRFSKPCVRWWEVDHPDTQSDKLARIERLGIVATHVTFVGHDLRDPDLADAVAVAGYDATKASVIICEGVCVYLEPPALQALLGQLRLMASGGTRLALSLSEVFGSGSQVERRKRLEAAAHALGVTDPNPLDPGEASGMLAAVGWRRVAISAKATAAGFVVAALIQTLGRVGAAPKPDIEAGSRARLTPGIWSGPRRKAGDSVGAGRLRCQGPLCGSRARAGGAVCRGRRSSTKYGTYLMSSTCVEATIR